MGGAGAKPALTSPAIDRSLRVGGLSAVHVTSLQRVEVENRFCIVLSNIIYVEDIKNSNLAQNTIVI